MKTNRILLSTLIAAIAISAAAGAGNINGNGVSLNLPTTDLFSGGIQTNSAGGRLISAGTPSAGVVSTNGSGAKVIIEPMNVIAGSGAPVADFAANPLSGRAPLDVQFTDLSTGGLYAVDAWTWNFGDSSPASSEQNPKHTYNDPGTYSVSLTITTVGGSPLVRKNNYIAVTQGLPTARHTGLLLMSAVMSALGALRKPGADTGAL